MKNKSDLLEKITLLRHGIALVFHTSALYTILILSLIVISALLPPINALVLQKLLDSIVQMVQAGAWHNSGLFFLLLSSIINVVSFFLRGTQSLIKRMFSDKLNAKITVNILRKSLLLPMETFDKAKTYNHINTAITQTSSNCLNLLETVSEVIYSTVKGLSFVYILLDFSWYIALASLVSVIPLLHLSTKINKYWYKIYNGRVEKKRMIEHLKMLMVKNENIKEIRLFNIGEKIITIISKQFIRFQKEDAKARKHFLNRKILMQCVDNAVAFGVKLWLLLLGMQRGCSLGTIILYFNSLDDLKLSYNELIEQFSSLQNSLQYLEALDVLENTVVCSDKGKLKFSRNFHEIEFRNVSFKYPDCDNYALKNISITFERGKTYFVVGFNGSGKTTLIKLLLGLYEPTEGEILIDGISIANLDLSEYYSYTSAVFQDFIKYPFDVYDNIAVRCADKSKEEFYAALEFVGMREFVEALPNQEHTLLMKEWSGGIEMSQGQWQKLAIARCVFNDGLVYILDEPFSSLDAESENRIITNIRNSSEEKLTIVISHRFSSISRTDQIVVLEKGMIAENGTHDELMSNRDTYFKLFEAQQIN